jgi:hypothetical protein
MMYIRRATDEDIPWLLEQLQAFADFYGTKRPLMPSDPDVAAAVIRSLIASTEFFIADLPESARSASSPASSRRTCSIPSSASWRSSSGGSCRASRLDGTARDSSSTSPQFGRQHAHWVTMTLESASPIDDRVLQKRGFQLHERSYLLEV